MYVDPSGGFSPLIHDRVPEEYYLNNINNSFSPLRVNTSITRGLVPGSRGTVPVAIATRLEECTHSPLRGVWRDVGKTFNKK